MSNAIAVPATLSREDIDLVKATVAKGATDLELKLFLERCQRMGLDPLKPGQIHFVKFNNSPGTIIIGREGFRSRAGQTGQHAGTKVGVLRNDQGKCVGAWCEVFRKDWTHPARVEVSLAEYDTGRNQWAKMPETMIQKVAECAALRMAFPDELGGVYAAEEMDQAENEVVRPPAPPILETLNAADEADPGEYVVPFGSKYRGQKIKDIDMFDLDGYRNWLAKDLKRQNLAPYGDYSDFLDASEAYLATREAKR